MKLKDIFTGIIAVGISAICLARLSDNELHTSILPYRLIERIPAYGEIDRSIIDNHAAELDSAQAVYGPLFNRWEALVLCDASIDSAYMQIS